MTILVEDSPRNLLLWLQEAVAAGNARGGVLTPFATPWVNRTGAGARRGAREVASVLTDAGTELWFDATTHALQMAGVGDFRYYDEYDLWGGPRGNLSTPAFREDHVRLVFETQDSLHAPHLAPTILLHHGESGTSQQALDLARAAIDRDPGCWLTVAGTAPVDMWDLVDHPLVRLEPTRVESRHPSSRHRRCIARRPPTRSRPDCGAPQLAQSVSSYQTMLNACSATRFSISSPLAGSRGRVG